MIWLAIILLVIVMIIGAYVQFRLRSVMSEYSNMPLWAGLSGAEVARRMLEAHGIYDVKIVEGRGWLTDHYNPLTKTISLSPEVYHGRSVMAAAVAAHECGHAVQHAQGYVPVKVRSALVPVLQIGGTILNVLLIVGFLTFFALGQIGVIFLYVAVGYYLLLTLFSLVTLPVEIDASVRAYRWLQQSGLATAYELPHIRRGLKWAAYTYVVAVLSALSMLLYYLALLMSARDR